MEHIIMNKKEREQLVVFAKLKKGEISQIEASLQLGITSRWIREKYKRYKEHLDRGIVHRNRGATSKRRWDENQRNVAIGLLLSEWNGFGPTFAAEKLWELKEIKISKETLRKEMIKAGIWQGKKRKPKYRKRRDRRAMLGMMIQLDGSPHDWFEGRGDKCTLLVFIDDATSQLLWLEFVKSESSIDVMKATKNYISRHGIPQAFYVDFGSVFSVNLNNADRDKKTHWQRAVESLSTTVHHAHSPQAKGRVERANKTLQDRLIKEMRLAKINSMEAANQFLRDTDFINKHNQHFAIQAEELGNAHRPIDAYNLDEIFCLKEERILMQDYTLSYNKRIFQLDKQQKTIIRPKDSIIINTRLDGSIYLSIRKTILMFKEIYKSINHERKDKKVKIVTQYIPHKPQENSRRWVSGKWPLPPQNSRERRVG